jgi:hypothetical protein
VTEAGETAPALISAFQRSIEQTTAGARKFQ